MSDSMITVTGRQSVALINPNRLQPGVAPVALEYLASELEFRGVDVRLLDLCHVADPGRAVREFFAGFHPNLVGITLRNMDDVVFNCFLAEEVRPLVAEIRRSTNAPVVIGGSGFSIAPEQLLRYYELDLGIVGEGEAALPMLLDRLGVPERYSEVPGLVYREGSSIKTNPPECCDVNCLHLAKRGRLRYEDYSYKDGRRGSGGVQTKRGCSNRCIYCTVPNIEGRTIRTRDPRDIADEVESLAALGIRRVFLCDSEFNYPIEHAMGVCEEFLSRRLQEKLSWQAYASPGAFSVELARKMKAAGCDLLITTIDSGEDALLERWNKPFRTEDIVKCVHACQEAELNASYCLMIGGPDETVETVLKTLTLMRGLKPAKVTFGEPPGLRIYPDTPLAEMVRAEGFTPSNPNLRGPVLGNEDLLRPVYYLSHGMGAIVPLVQSCRKIGELHHRLVRR